MSTFALIAHLLEMGMLSGTVSFMITASPIRSLSASKGRFLSILRLVLLLDVFFKNIFINSW